MVIDGSVLVLVMELLVVNLVHVLDVVVVVMDIIVANIEVDLWVGNFVMGAFVMDWGVVVHWGSGLLLLGSVLLRGILLWSRLGSGRLRVAVVVVSAVTVVVIWVVIVRFVVSLVSCVVEDWLLKIGLLMVRVAMHFVAMAHILMTDGHLLNFVDMMSMVTMSVRWAHFLWVSVVVWALLDVIVLLRARHGEVQRLVLTVLVVISVILVAVSVLRGHVMVGWVLVVVRADVMRGLMMLNVVNWDNSVGVVVHTVSVVD